MNLMKCLLKIYPDWKGTVWGNNKIRPHELETRPIPTKNELEDAWLLVQADEVSALIDDMLEEKIKKEIGLLNRTQAIASLQAKGEL